MPDQKYKMSDHDLLQRLDQKVDGLIETIKELQTGTVFRIESLEKMKANRDEIDLIQKKLDDNIEVRVRSLETDRVTQQEHSIVLEAIGKLENGQTRIYAFASALTFSISLIIALIDHLFK
jgi:hypothetical protein